MKVRLFPVLGVLFLAALVFTQGAGASGLLHQPSGVNSQEAGAAADCPVPPSKDLPRFARLMHDPQWMPWPSRMGDPDWPKSFYLDWYPETVALLANPNGTKSSVRYNLEWLEFLRDLQPNDQAATFITRIAAGLFNINGNDSIPILDLDQLVQEPVAESISSGGNVVKVLETKNGSAQIEMIYLKTNPPDPNQINYQTTPWLVTKFTSVSVRGQLGIPGGRDTYFPNLASQEEGYWVELRRVELFPALPLCVTAKDTITIVNTRTGLAKAVFTLEAGESVIVREYLPQGSDVWGRTDEGWLLLEYLKPSGAPIYPTSWEMNTRPPILYP